MSRDASLFDGLDGAPWPVGGDRAAGSEALAALEERVLDAETQISRLLAALHDPKQPTVFRWERVDARDALALWEPFTAWVRDVSEWYRYPEIPGCPRWWSHRGLVEELTALWLEWRSAYAARGGPSDPRYFHESLDRARARCGLIANNCGPLRHSEPEPLPAQEPAPSFAEAAAIWPLPAAAPYTADYPPR